MANTQLHVRHFQDRRQDHRVTHHDVSDPPHGLAIKFLNDQTYLKSNFCPYRPDVKRQQKSKRHGKASFSTCTMCNSYDKGFIKPRRRKESLQRDVKNWSEYEFWLIMENDMLDYCYRKGRRCGYYMTGEHYYFIDSGRYRFA